MQYQGKIFGLGFHKTETSTLASALRKLGYRTIHGDPRGSWAGADEGLTLTRLIDSGNYQLPTFGLFDAFVDNPYFSIWLKLVDIFPDARFIITLLIRGSNWGRHALPSRVGLRLEDNHESYSQGDSGEARV